MAKPRKVVKKGSNAQRKVHAYQLTVNLHKRLHDVTTKKRAPRAIGEIKKAVAKTMRLHADNVHIDTALNKFIWSKGIDRVPYRVRVLAKPAVNEDNNKQRYAVVTHVPLPNTFVAKDVKGKQVMVPLSSAQQFKGSVTIKTNLNALSDE